MTDYARTDAPRIYDNLAHRELFRRLNDLDTAPDYPVDDAEPLDVQAERVASHFRLWQARQQWEREQRDLDARAASIARSEQDRARVLADRDLPTPAQIAERAAADQRAQRLRRVRLAASQAGLTHRIDVLRLAGDPIETHRLLAPEGHPALRRVHPWEPDPSPTRLAGLLTVDVGDTLEDVEDWLGLPHDGTGRRRDHDAATGRAPESTR